MRRHRLAIRGDFTPEHSTYIDPEMLDEVLNKGLAMESALQIPTCDGSVTANERSKAQPTKEVTAREIQRPTRLIETIWMSHDSLDIYSYTYTTWHRNFLVNCKTNSAYR